MDGIGGDSKQVELPRPFDPKGQRRLNQSVPETFEAGRETQSEFDLLWGDNEDFRRRPFRIAMRSSHSMCPIGVHRLIWQDPDRPLISHM